MISQRLLFLLMPVAFGLTVNVANATLLTQTTVDPMLATSITSPIWESVSNSDLTTGGLAGLGALDPNDSTDNIYLRRNTSLADVAITYKTADGYKFGKVEVVIMNPDIVVHRSFTATLKADGNSVTPTVSTLGTLSGSYTVYMYTFDLSSVTASDTVVFTYSSTGSISENAAYPDVSSIKLYVSQVPEPATVSMAILGGVAMLMSKYRTMR